MKKTKSKGDKNRPYHFKLGLIAAFSLLLASFDWASYTIEETYYTHGYGLDNPTLSIEEYSNVEIEPPAVQKENQNTMEREIVKDDVVIPEEGEEKKNPLDELIKNANLNFSVVGGTGDPIADTDLTEIWDANTVEIAPYYLDCENILDRAEQSACSYHKIRNMIQTTAVYPRICAEAGIGGTVWVTFVVSETGAISNVDVARSVHPKLDKAAMDAVSKLPKMEPASQQGMKVPVNYRIPVDFIVK